MRKKLAHLTLMAIFMSIDPIQPLFAASATWTTLTGGTQAWDANANWNAAFPNAAADDAFLNVDLSANTTIRLNASTLTNSAININTLTIGDTNGTNTFTINAGPNSGANTQLILNNIAGISMVSTSLNTTINANLGVASNIQNWTNSSLSGNLIINGNVAAAGAATSRTLTITGVGDTLIAGIVSDGTGTLGVDKRGTGTLTLTGSNSYTGITKVINGVMSVSTLANGGVASNIGASANDAANLLLNGGTLQYTGAAVTTDRLFTFGTNNSAIDSSGTGALNFSNTGLIVFSGNGVRNLTLTGSNNGSLAAILGEDPSGATSLIKSGAGTWSLSGVNTYTGITQILAGTLSIKHLADGGAGSSIGASINAAANLVIDGGALQYTAGSANIDRLFTLGNGGGAINYTGGGTLTFANTGPIAFTGNGARTLALGGSGDGKLSSLLGNGTGGATSLTKNDTGTWSLTGANTYTGATTILDGILNVSSLANGGAASPIGASTKAAANLLIDGGTLRYTGSSVSTDRLFTIGIGGGAINSSGGGVLTFNNVGSVAFQGSGARTLTLTGNGDGSMAATLGDGSGGATSLVKDGTGSWSLTGSNTYTGSTSILNGTLNASSLANGGANSSIGKSSSVATNLVLSFGGSLEYTGSAVSTDRLFQLGQQGSAASGIISSGSGVLNFTNPGSITFGVVGSTTNLLLSGDSDGIFSPVLPDAPGSAIAGLVKTGTGTWTLTGSNSYTNITNIQGGILSVSSLANTGVNSNLGASGTISLGGGTLRYTGSAVSTNRSLAVNSGGGTLDASGSGELNFTNTGTITGSGTLTLTGTGNGSLAANLSGNAFGNALVKSGAGTWSLTGTSSYQGKTLLNQGVLSVAVLSDGGINSSIGKSGSAAANLVFNGGTLRYTGALPASNTTDRSFTLDTNGGTLDASGALQMAFNGVDSSIAFINAGPRTLTLTGSSIGSLSLLLGDSTGPTSLVKNGAGDWTLNGNNSYSGATLINAGALKVSGGNAIGDVSAVTLADVAGAQLELLSLETDETIGSLAGGGAGGGNVLLNENTLITGANNASTTFAGVIAGVGGLIKIGSGTMTLSGMNTYDGRTRIQGGVLSVSSLANGGVASGIGVSTNAAANLVLDTGTLQYTGAAATTDRLFTLGAGGGTIDSSGSGGLTLNNTGTIAFSGPGTRTLTLTGASNGILAAAIVNSSGSATSLTKTGADTWSLTGINSSYTGATSILGGVLNVSKLANGGANSSIGASTNAAANLVIMGGTLRYTGSAVTTDRLFTLGVGNGTIDSSGSGGLTLNNTGTIAFTGTGTRTLTLTGSSDGLLAAKLVNNAGSATSLAKTGSGIWTLSGTSTYTGATTINAGTLRVSGGNAIGDLSAVTLANAPGAQLELLSNETIGSLAGGGASGGNVLLNGNTLTTGGKNTSTQFDGLVSGAGGLIKTGTGFMVLTRANTYTGPTQILGGLLNVSSLANGGAASGIGASTNAAANLVLAGDGVLNYTGDTVSTDRLFTLGTGGARIFSSGSVNSLTSELTSTLTFSNPGSIAFQGSGPRDLFLGGISDGVLQSVIGNGSGGETFLAMSGSGTWSLTGTNTYTGATNIFDGVLSVSKLANGGANSSIGASTNAAANLVIIGGTLQYTGSAVTTDRLFTLGANKGGGGLDASGSGGLTMNNSGPIAFTVIGARTLTLTGSGSGSLAAQIGNDVSGATSLAKSGSGAWTLSGNNTYTGTTTVNAGVLSIAAQHNSGGNYTVNSTGKLNLVFGSSITLAAGAGLTINSGGTLSGAGSINTSGTGSVINKGTIAPGASPGLLTLGGNYSSTSTAHLAMEIGGINAGSQFDQLAITGSAALSGSLDISLINGFDPAPLQTFTLLTGSTVSGSFASISLTGSSTKRFATSVNSNSVVLTAVSLGDVNADGLINATDIDLLMARINTANPNFAATQNFALYDLSGDAAVDNADLAFLLNNILHRRQGDANLDGNVDVGDLSVLRSNLGGANFGWASGNFDGDGDVDANDLSIFRGNIGLPAPGLDDQNFVGAAFAGSLIGTSVPEPSMWAGLLLVGAAMGRKGRRRN